MKLRCKKCLAMFVFAPPLPSNLDLIGAMKLDNGMTMDEHTEWCGGVLKKLPEDGRRRRNKMNRHVKNRPSAVLGDPERSDLDSLIGMPCPLCKKPLERGQRITFFVKTIPSKPSESDRVHAEHMRPFNTDGDYFVDLVEMLG